MEKKRSSSKQMKKYLALAEKMAVRQGMTDGEIQSNLQEAVSLRWLSTQRKTRGWDDRREEWMLSTDYVAEHAMSLLALEIKKWDTLGKAEADTLIKAVKAIKGLDNEVDILGTALVVVEDLAEFLETESKEAFELLRGLLPDFLRFMREKHKR